MQFGPMEPQHDDISGATWTALMMAIGFTLAAMDYSPPELRTTRMFLQRVEELLEESFQRFPILGPEEKQDARRLAQTLRNQVQSASDTICSDFSQE